MRTAVLLALACLATNAAWAQVQFPSNPQSSQECTAAHDRAYEMVRAYRDRAHQYYEESRAIDRQTNSMCGPLAGRSPYGAYDRCRQPGDQRSRELGRLQMQASGEADRILGNATAARQQCMQIARMNEQRVADQRRMAEEQQRRQQQTAQHNAEMQRMQAEQQRQQDRAPHVVANSPMSAPVRNEPRVIAAPNPQAQIAAAQQAEQVRRLQQAYENAQTGQALRDLYELAKDARQAKNEGGISGEVASKRVYDKQVEVTQRVIDKQLNPRGNDDPGIGLSVLAATETNSKVNELRFGSPEGTVISSIANTSISAVGSVANDALAQLNVATVSLDDLSMPRPGPAATPTPSPAPEAPAEPVASLDQLAAAQASAPTDACKAVAAEAERAQCLAAQCKLSQFTAHPACRSPSQ